MDGQTQSMIQPFLAMLYFFGLKVDLQLVFARFDAANLLLKKANTTCLDDLMKLSEAELYEIYCNTDDGESLFVFLLCPASRRGLHHSGKPVSGHTGWSRQG